MAGSPCCRPAGMAGLAVVIHLRLLLPSTHYCRSLCENGTFKFAGDRVRHAAMRLKPKMVTLRCVALFFIRFSCWSMKLLFSTTPANYVLPFIPCVGVVWLLVCVSSESRRGKYSVRAGRLHTASGSKPWPAPMLSGSWHGRAGCHHPSAAAATICAPPPVDVRKRDMKIC